MGITGYSALPCVKLQRAISVHYTSYRLGCKRGNSHVQKRKASHLLQLVSCALCQCPQCCLLLHPRQSIPTCFLIGFHWVWLTVKCKSGKLGVLAGKQKITAVIFMVCGPLSDTISISAQLYRPKWGCISSINCGPQCPLEDATGHTWFKFLLTTSVPLCLLDWWWLSIRESAFWFVVQTSGFQQVRRCCLFRAGPNRIAQNNR